MRECAIGEMNSLLSEYYRYRRSDTVFPNVVTDSFWSPIFKVANANTNKRNQGHKIGFHSIVTITHVFTKQKSKDHHNTVTFEMIFTTIGSMKFLFLISSLMLTRASATFNVTTDLSGFFDGTTPQETNSKDEGSTRIVGGSTTSPGKYPFFTFLDLGGGKFCGGSLVHEDIVLTAGEMESNETSLWVGNHCSSPIHVLTHCFFNLV